MSVHSISVGYGDILLHRGADDTVGPARWTRDMGDGQGFVGVDLTGWTGEFTMSLPDGRQVYSQSCRLTTGGYASLTIPASAFADDTWRARPTGEWRIDLTGPGGRRELMAWGHWTLAG